MLVLDLLFVHSNYNYTPMSGGGSSSGLRKTLAAYTLTYPLWKDAESPSSRKEIQTQRQ